MPMYRPALNWHPGAIAGKRYPVAPDSGATTAAFALADQVYLAPFILGASITPVSLGLMVTAGGAGSSFKIGVWNNNRATMRPTGLPFMSSNADSSTAGTGSVQATVTGVPLAPGVLYWIGAKFTGTLPTLLMILNTSVYNASLMGEGVGTNATNSIQGFRAADTYANNIAALDLTGAGFTSVLGSLMPHYEIGT